jgi:hypothetical protein
VLGWALAIAAYCLVFGGTAPVPVLKNLLFGPIEVATHGGDVYGGGIRQYVVQTLTLNAGLYAICAAGMSLELARIQSLAGPRRIALIFAVVMTVLVFAHNQPWPYVFIMAQPFIALWAPVPFDRLAPQSPGMRLAVALLGVAVAISFARNVAMLRIDNREQLKLVARAEALLPPDQVCFDGVGMLPNRREPSTLWLDATYVRKTLREGTRSEAYRIFASNPPRMIIWSYRMDAIAGVLDPLIRDSYIQVAPNLRLAGRRLRAGEPARFNVPVAGVYALYDEAGRPVQGRLAIDGVAKDGQVELPRGSRAVTLIDGPASALLLPSGTYAGRLSSGPDNPSLFEDVYN